MKLYSKTQIKPSGMMVNRSLLNLNPENGKVKVRVAAQKFETFSSFLVTQI